MCGILFERIVMIFTLLLHLNGLHSRLIYRVCVMLLGLGYVYFWVIISVTCGLIISGLHMYMESSVCVHVSVYENK